MSESRQASFCLSLQALAQEHRFDDIVTLKARDASGSFAIRAGHESMVACLLPGLLSFRDVAGQWRYVAQPGAVLWCRQNHLRIAGRQFLLSETLDPLLAELDNAVQRDQRLARDQRRTALQVEQALTRRLLQLGRPGESL